MSPVPHSLNGAYYLCLVIIIVPVICTNINFTPRRNTYIAHAAVFVGVEFEYAIDTGTGCICFIK